MKGKMDKIIANRIKKLRVDNCLTQKELAKMFYLTEKTISNYETGIRTPDIHFLNNLCQKFNVTLDYFLEYERKPSNYKDLIVVEKNGKKALFDVVQSLYLSAHLYDKILISPCGYHILAIVKDEKIVKSLVVDNLGKGYEFADLTFGLDAFNKNGVASAIYNGKIVKANYKGEIIK